MIGAGPAGLMKNAYRKFNIKAADLAPGDDYGAMREVLTRRFARAQKEDPERKLGQWPDLVLLDGGQGQLNAGLKVLADLGISDLSIAGIAKGPDRNAGREQFFLPGRESFMLPPNHPVLYFLQRLRDEAHRFAITAHRAKRSKAIGQSLLDEVAGIGPARKKAELLGIKSKNIFIDDVREEFVKDFVFPMFRANALYEGQYLLGTSIARPLIAKRQIEIARQVGADAVSHGATGKGNDQVRFELGYYALNPDIKVIAPWREWDLTSRTRLIEFAEQHQIPVAKDKRGESPFSTDANLLHTSSEGKVLEDPAVEAPEYVHMRTISPEEAPDRVTEITIDFEKGDATAVDGIKMSPATLLTKLNELGQIPLRRPNISEAAARSGVSAKMIRHYESLGLLPAPPRTASGYRQYDAPAIHTLQFIRRARDMGFGIADIAALLDLWRDHSRSSASVKRIAQQHIDELSRRITQLTDMKRTLQNLADCCAGDDRPDCPILDTLDSTTSSACAVGNHHPAARQPRG